MSRKLSMTRKNIYRREETEKVRIERVVTGYLKYRYPEIYEEAYSFYNHLNELYPNKKDLRRSNEYELLKRGTFETMRKYYPRKTTGKTTVKTTDNMILNIELMSKTTVESSLEPEVTQQASTMPEVTQETVVKTSTTPEAAEAAQETSMALDLPGVSDEVLNRIISGLREDPDISNIFDNIDFEEDNCPLW